MQVHFAIVVVFFAATFECFSDFTEGIFTDSDIVSLFRVVSDLVKKFRLLVR